MLKVPLTYDTAQQLRYVDCRIRTELQKFKAIPPVNLLTLLEHRMEAHHYVSELPDKAGGTDILAYLGYRLYGDYIPFAYCIELFSSQERAALTIIQDFKSMVTTALKEAEGINWLILLSKDNNPFWSTYLPRHKALLLDTTQQCKVFYLGHYQTLHNK